MVMLLYLRPRFHCHLIVNPSLKLKQGLKLLLYYQGQLQQPVINTLCCTFDNPVSDRVIAPTVQSSLPAPVNSPIIANQGLSVSFSLAPESPSTPGLLQQPSVSFVPRHLLLEPDRGGTAPVTTEDTAPLQSLSQEIVGTWSSVSSVPRYLGFEPERGESVQNSSEETAPLQSLSKDKFCVKVGDKPQLVRDAFTDLDGVNSDSLSLPNSFSKSVTFDSPSQSKVSTLVGSPEFVVNNRVSRIEMSLSSQPESQEMDGVEVKAPEETPPQRTPLKAKFDPLTGEKENEWPRYCHNTRLSLPLIMILTCFMILPIILFAPQHKVPFQVFHLKLAMKSFWPLETNGLVFGVPLTAAMTSSFKWTGNGHGDDPSRKVIDPIISCLKSRSGAFDLIRLFSLCRNRDFNLIKFLANPRTVGKSVPYELRHMVTS